MKPGSKDIKLDILITGEELAELQRYTSHMAEAFGLDRRIENLVCKFNWHLIAE